MTLVLSSPSPVSPLVDLLPLSLGPILILKYIVTTGNMTVLNNAQSAEYIHTLNVAGGLYTCTVENSKPSSDSAHLRMKGTELIIITCYKGNKNISIKMLKYVGMVVPKSRETSVVYIYAATQGMRDYIYMQQNRG